MSETRHVQCADCGKCRVVLDAEEWCGYCAFTSCERGPDCSDAMSGPPSARGGVIEGSIPVHVLVRFTEDGLREYWESELGRWVRILTPEEVQEYAAKGVETLRSNFKETT